MSFKTFTALVFTLFSLNAFAQSNTGNGGDALICNESSPIPSLMYDLFEASFLKTGSGKALTPALPKTLYPSFTPIPKITVAEAIDFYLRRLGELDPFRRDEYKDSPLLQDLLTLENMAQAALTQNPALGHLPDFDAESDPRNKELSQALLDLAQSITLKTRVTTVFPSINDIPDEGIASIPPGCKLKQFAIQRKGHFSISLYAYLKTRSDAWNIAALFGHEMFWKERAGGGRDSMSSRFMNAMVLHGVDKLTYFTEVLEKWEFKIQVEKYDSSESYLLHIDRLDEKHAVLTTSQHISQGFDYISVNRFIYALPSFRKIAILIQPGRDELGDWKWNFEPRYFSRLAVLADRIHPTIILEHPTKDIGRYIYDLNGRFRYLSDQPLLKKVKFNGITYKNPAPVMEFDAQGNRVYSGTESRLGAVLKKLESELAGPEGQSP